MGFWHRNREPQASQTETREPLVDLNVKPSQPGETRTRSWLRRRRVSDAETPDSPAQPQPPGKAHRPLLSLSKTRTSEPSVGPEPQKEQEATPKPGRSRGAITHPCDYLPEVQNIVDSPRSVADESARAPHDKAPEPQPSAKSGRRCLAMGQAGSDEPPSEPQPESGRRRVRIALDTPVALDASPSPPTVGRSRGAMTHPCDDPPGLQNIIDPPPSIRTEPAPAPSDQTPTSQTSVDPAQVQQFIQQFVAELRTKQNFSMALIAGLVVAIIAAAAWALITTATNYQIGWMAVGVGLLVGGTVRMLGRGIDKSFGYLGATLSVFGCLLGNLLSVCAIVAGQEGLSLVAVLGHVCVRPAIIPAALIATFHPLDLVFYGIAIYEGYRFSFRRVSDTEISRSLCRQ